MSEEAAAPASGPWPVLDLLERRILGVLVEKAKTTPDVYPLSINALISGCNQKSNRDPLMTVNDHEVEQTLARCQKKNLVERVTGARVDRWRHTLYSTWSVDKVDLAVLAELLLRGPQTEGELRSRAARMEPIDDLDALRAVLKPLSERNLIVYLTAGDRRGAMLTHGFHDQQELEGLRQRAASMPAAPAAVSSPRGGSAAGETALGEVRSEITALKDLIRHLESDIAALRAEVENIRQSSPAPGST
jgi:uncharacterized protein YceH (UPF0502 family)